MRHDTAARESARQLFQPWHDRVARRVARLQAVQGELRVSYLAPLRAYFEALYAALGDGAAQAGEHLGDQPTREIVHDLLHAGFTIGEIVTGVVELKALARGAEALRQVPEAELEGRTDRLVQAVSSACGKLAQQKIRNTEKSFQQLLDESAWGMFTTNAAGVITYMNPALCTLLNLSSRDALLGHPFLPAEFWEVPQEREEFERQLAKQRPFSREVAWRRRGGEPLSVILTVAFGPQGRGPVEEIKGIVHDISKRRRIEEEVRQRNEELEAATQRYRAISKRYRGLAEKLEQKVAERTARLEASERFFRTVLDSIRDAIIIVDRNYTMTFMNKSPQYALKKPIQAMLGQTCHQEFRKLSAPCDLCPGRKTFATGEPGYSQHNAWKDDGSEYFVELYTFPVKNEAGEVEYVIEYVRDITKRRAMEQQLIKNEKLAVAGTLAAGVAHEVNNPLASISSLVQFLKQDDVTPEQRELLETIFTQVTRISGILQELMNFARPRSEGQELTNLNQLLQQTLRLISFNRDFRQVAITCHLDEHLPRVMVNPDQIQQVLIDMLLNAADAVSGGGTVTLRTRLHGLAQTAEEICIEIEDNGVGINEENLRRIFDPFFSTKPSGKGTGLGLSVCHGIIAAHGGRIEVQSQPARGARFTIILPRTPRTAPGARQVHAAQQAST